MEVLIEAPFSGDCKSQRRTDRNVVEKNPVAGNGGRASADVVEIAEGLLRIVQVG